MREEKALLSWRPIPDLTEYHNHPCLATLTFTLNGATNRTALGPKLRNFASLSVSEKNDGERKEFAPTPAQLLKHPLSILALVPKDAALFAAGAVAGAAAKTVTAPLDRIKILMQTHGVRVGQESAKKAIGFIEAITMIGKEEGLKGYWKGNLPQVIRVIPYSAVQLFAYETYKKLFRGKDGELSLIGRLAAGACAGMTSTFIALNMLKEEGVAAFYYGLGPSLIGIAPYIAVNFCVFDLVKKSLPENFQKKAEASMLTALVSASLATLTCYPLDTVRRQMQMRGTPYKTVLDAIPGIVARDGFVGLYRGFLPNALKTLPNSSIRLTTYDFVKRLIARSEKELQKITEENRHKQNQSEKDLQKIVDEDRHKNNTKAPVVE
ncbi:hypothetical protein F8388_022529 [Cannabis sativa]|uniref:Uncharacterized protein n=1 Tax=Cannabis sativa TaxID=3483 RepID=A0A7J6EJY5_CANSA|nr:hypothetical protein F8388_022529 [Cannabis sativa]